MKTPLKLLAPFMGLISLIILFTECNIVPISDLRTVEVTYFGKDTFQVKAGQAAGTYFVQDKVISQNMDAFLKKAGIDKKSIATARLDSTTITIPRNVDLVFEDLEEGLFTLEGLSKISGNVDKVTIAWPGSKGKSTKLIPQRKDMYDVRNLIMNASKLSCGASLKTKRATPYSDIYVQYSITIGYQVVQ